MYNRYFITLKENDQNATLEKQTAFGKCILETNNQNLKISLSVQHLRNDYIYKVFIIYKKDFSNIEGIYIENIILDTKGKGELKKEFNKHEFLGKEMPDDFDAIFVVAIKNKRKSLVLEGYKNEKFVWNKSFLDTISDIRSNENIKLKQSNEYSNVKEELVQNIIQQVKTDIQQEKKDPKESLIKRNPPMIPFQKQNRNVKWVRINLEEINYLPVDYFSYVSNPFILNAYKKYNHLVLGYVNDKLGENYYLGIPEMYEETFQKTANNYGFMQFKCCDDTKVKDGEYGYWLSKIN